MNTSLFSTTLSMTLLVAANLAFAAPRDRRNLEDHALTAESQARDIRTEIQNDFRSSSDYRFLVNQSAQLQSLVGAIHDSLHRNKPTAALHFQIRQAQRVLHDLSMHLDASDFAQIRTSRPVFNHRNSGYIRRDSGRHPGYVHYQVVKRSINDLETTLNCLRDDLPQAHSGRPMPSNRPVPLPTQGGNWNGGRSNRNDWLVPSASGPRPTFSNSVNLGSRGEFVLRFPMN